MKNTKGFIHIAGNGESGIQAWGVRWHKRAFHDERDMLYDF